MKLTHEDIEDLMREIYGKEILPLVQLLKGRKNVNEFKIAEKLELTINQTRNMFYKLQDRGLIISTRKKDKKKGWYVYYWTFNDKEAKKLIVDHRNMKLHVLRRALSKEQEIVHFICKDNHVRIRYEEALEQDFRCPECGELLIEEDKDKILRKMKSDIKTLEKEVIIEEEKIVKKKEPIKKATKKKTKKTTKKKTKKIVKKKPKKQSKKKTKKTTKKKTKKK
jgi:transcription initiation factor TFIIE subunit alpha|tara:strand:+ start:191 stop:859 length:669 start_codon:yes stop_codon:yes gene_type:complete